MQIMRANILISVALYVFGIVLPIIGYCLRRRVQAFLESSVEVYGTVISMEKIVNRNGGGASYAPFIEYKDDQGRLFTIQKFWGSFRPPCEVGATWPVFYEAQDPQNARLGPRQEIFRPSRNCFVAGVISLIFGTLELLIPYLPV